MDTVRWASLPEDLRVMPFNLRFMGFIGLWGPRRKVYKFLVLLIFATMVIMFPKVVLGIGSSDITVICKGVAEFVFELPNFVTLTILALKRQRFEMKIDINLINVMLIFSITLLQVFGYSYLGSELAEEAEAVGKVIYDLPWYEHSVELQRFYRLIIQHQLPSRMDTVRWASLPEHLRAMPFNLRFMGFIGLWGPLREIYKFLVSLIFATMVIMFPKKVDLNLINVMIIFGLSLAQVFGYSYLGSQLTEEADAVGKAIYDLHWYEHSIELQRFYRLIIQRTQRPTGITGATFFIVQRTTFASTNQPHKMVAIAEELQVMPFNLRILELIGLWGNRGKLYRFLLAFTYVVMVIMFPKAVLGVGSSDAMQICKGIAEFIFELSNLKLDPNLLNVMIIFLLTLVQTFGYSYLGTELAEEAEAVGKAIYDLPWYEHSVELQRFYRLMIQRTQRPTGITGAKFFIVQLTTFASVVQMSYSYYLVLRDVLNKL
ncbi:olfactory receptor [Culex quinquefasciatus]|uniref:Odorant receptor n=1 Tax=Culex quinquefasciatus TaxID=7176 RepID=B0WAX1_CULQU|nr:olfactory receptor [Culex quinquefasciatus]|eukprot:XP_001845855.1 olfactory receptor [Culex quinquefasciatus]